MGIFQWPFSLLTQWHVQSNLLECYFSSSFIEFPLFLFAEEEIRTQAQDPTYGFLSSSPLFYLCTSFSPPQSLSFQPFCATTQNTKGEVQLKQNRSYPGFLVFLPGKELWRQIGLGAFNLGKQVLIPGYLNIHSAVEFVMNVLYTRSTKCVCGGEGAGIFNGLLSFFINHVFVGVRCKSLMDF